MSFQEASKNPKKRSYLSKIQAFTYKNYFLAEREGFEPPDLLQSTVFKTAALDRSAISPAQK
jgi:hypothetical protein